MRVLRSAGALVEHKPPTKGVLHMNGEFLGTAKKVKKKHGGKEHFRAIRNSSTEKGTGGNTGIS